MLPDSRLAYNSATAYRNLAPSSTGAIVVARAADIFTVVLSNTDTAAIFVKFYDKATAATSSDTPVFTIPVNTLTSIALDLSEPWRFSTGISVRAVKEQADAGTTGPTAATCTINLTYK
jgi:hypothetical protein